MTEDMNPKKDEVEEIVDAVAEEVEAIDEVVAEDLAEAAMLEEVIEETVAEDIVEAAVVEAVVEEAVAEGELSRDEGDAIEAAIDEAVVEELVEAVSAEAAIDEAAAEEIIEAAIAEAAVMDAGATDLTELSRRVEGPALYTPREIRGRARRVSNDAKLEDITYKNIPLLTQFLDGRGRILSRRKTRVSAKMQRQAARAIKRARHLALLPYTGDHTRITRKRR